MPHEDRPLVHLDLAVRVRACRTAGPVNLLSGSTAFDFLFWIHKRLFISVYNKKPPLGFCVSLICTIYVIYVPYMYIYIYIYQLPLSYVVLLLLGITLYFVSGLGRGLQRNGPFGPTAPCSSCGSQAQEGQGRHLDSNTCTQYQ